MVEIFAWGLVLFIVGAVGVFVYDTLLLAQKQKAEKKLTQKPTSKPASSKNTKSRSTKSTYTYSPNEEFLKAVKNSKKKSKVTSTASNDRTTYTTTMTLGELMDQLDLAEDLKETTNTLKKDMDQLNKDLEEAFSVKTKSPKKRKTNESS